MSEQWHKHGRAEAGKERTSRHWCSVKEGAAAFCAACASSAACALGARSGLSMPATSYSAPPSALQSTAARCNKRQSFKWTISRVCLS